MLEVDWLCKNLALELMSPLKGGTKWEDTLGLLHSFWSLLTLSGVLFMNVPSVWRKKAIKSTPTHGPEGIHFVHGDDAS